MKTLTRIVIATLLSASPVLGFEGGGGDDHGPPKIDLLRPMQLTLEDGARFRPARLVVEGPDGLLSAPIPYPVSQRDEDRIGLRFLPVIGGVFEPTANMEFEASLPVGAVLRAGDSLLIDFDRGLVVGDIIAGVRRVVVANMGLSYDIPVDFTASGAYAGGVPDSGTRIPLGRVLLARDTLLVIVAPSLVDPEG